ncbi:major facilitator superfamily domain-containing protein [Lipomyces tetrasporus]|uniref:Major facilitator superfamily domain-containing protein n=1 Tax=Lipomyces tetrasporus TaxID=54092 RepID=A0AAD7QP22_9ASCO|nr:major facilitator superfamily domain-containing protein [Lipomyces tetrasporus]KAJ8098316.1 major facilitator superfamily domain-containing protein [Lipomyces tetrasporus]
MSSGNSSDTELGDLETSDAYREKSELPKPTDVVDLDWDAPDDPENPKNWPLWRRWYTTFVVAWMCLVVTFGSSIFVSGTLFMAVEFSVSRTVALLGLSLYLIGLSFGPTIAAPISETVGRNPVYFISLPISMLFTAGVGKAQNIGTVLVCRLFCGLFASPVLAVAGGTIQDLWYPEMIGAAMCGFCLAPFAGPVLGPVIGGYLIEKKTWQWTMWVLLMFSGGILPLIATLRETYKPILLKRRAKKRGLQLPPKLPTGQALKLVVMVTLQRPFAMLFFEPIVLALSVYMAFVFAVLFGFFEAFPFVFSTVYEFSTGQTGLTFLGIGVGLLIGSAIYMFLDRTRYVPAMRLPVPPPPESRLLPAKIGAVALPISLFWLAWTSRKSVHWIVPVLAGVPFGMALILLFFTVATYFTLCYPAMATASALAANNMLRYLMAAGFPLFTIQMYEKMGIDWATSFYAFVALAMLPVPWALARYGARLRAGSRYGLKNELAELEVVQSI